MSWGHLGAAAARIYIVLNCSLHVTLYGGMGVSVVMMNNNTMRQLQLPVIPCQPKAIVTVPADSGRSFEMLPGSSVKAGRHVASSSIVWSPSIIILMLGELGLLLHGLQW